MNREQRDADTVARLRGQALSVPYQQLAADIKRNAEIAAAAEAADEGVYGNIKQAVGVK